MRRMVFKNIFKNKKIKFTFGFLILFVINVFSSAFGQDIGFYLTGLFNFVLSSAYIIGIFSL